MELLLLILIFGLAGYLFGASRLGRQVERPAERLAKASQSWAERFGTTWNSIFRPQSQAEAFRDWVNRQPADQFPENERAWLSGLEPQVLRELVKSLIEYSRGLGFSLNQLVEGGLDDQPRMRQVFVEAISVYSSAYRKARLAHQEAEAAGQPRAEESTAAASPAGKNKGQVGKSASHQTGDTAPVSEPASTD